MTDTPTPKEVRCAETINIYDSHWVVVTNRCALRAEHDGDHVVFMTACRPSARLCWRRDGET